jgi:acetolactate synthase regulatory subunit
MQVEPMRCPTNASWEADIIVVSANALANELLTQQIRKVSTGKIVLILESITDEKIRMYFEVLFL